jgi:hypothetical protein
MGVLHIQDFKGGQLTNRVGKGIQKGPSPHCWKPWKDQFDSIEEEGLLNDDDTKHGLTRRCYLLAFVVGFFMLFSFFSLILWVASRPTLLRKGEPSCFFFYKRIHILPF